MSSSKDTQAAVEAELDFALRHGLGFGIWGGTTGEERHRTISVRARRADAS